MYQSENGEECDDGNTKPGDGCSAKCEVEEGWTCAGGSWSHESICDRCGNGVLMAGEECDDGNTRNGDGCSNDCKIEPGFTCTVLPASQTRRPTSTCILDSSHQIGDTLKKMHSAYWRCARQGEVFVASNAESNHIGSCVAMPDKSAHPKVLAESSTQVSSLAGYSTRTIGRVAVRLTCPAPLESLKGGAPYAVCRENAYEVCRSGAALNRVCSFRKSVACEEVCV